jgi:hypothetical protein
MSGVSGGPVSVRERWPNEPRSFAPGPPGRPLTAEGHNVARNWRRGGHRAIERSQLENDATTANWRAPAGGLAQIQGQRAFARSSQRAVLRRRRGRSLCGVNVL